MDRWRIIVFITLGLFAADVGGLVMIFAPPAREPAVAEIASAGASPAATMTPPPTSAATASPSATDSPTVTASPAETSTPLPARTPVPPPTVVPSPTPTLTPAYVTATVTPAHTLPSLYVDGPFIRRSDTHQPVWLKGVNVEEFRQGTQHTLADLYAHQGLGVIMAQEWGINLLRVTIDPELISATLPEIDKTIAFAQANDLYVILVPCASATNPARSELRMAVPDNLAATTMGFLAGHFRDRTNVLYGIWNEPHPESVQGAGYDLQWQIWMQAAVKVAQAIRSRNPQSILVVPGGTKWARDLSFYKDHPFPFSSVIYDVHDYAAAPDYGYTRDIWTWAIGKYPLIVGEFGGNPVAPADPASIPYMQATVALVNQFPDLVHYAIYVLSDDGAWGLFTAQLQMMPRGNLLYEDLRRHAPTPLR